LPDWFLPWNNKCPLVIDLVRAYGGGSVLESTFHTTLVINGVVSWFFITLIFIYTYIIPVSSWLSCYKHWPKIIVTDV
jgi:hypothetical protein